MIHEGVLIALGSCTAMAAVLLALSRNPHSVAGAAVRRSLVAWNHVPSSRSVPIVIGVALLSLTLISASRMDMAGWAPSIVDTTAKSIASSDTEMSALRQYVDGLKRPGMVTANQSVRPDAPAELPDVDTMIDRLAKRLESEPGDADGWRTLGWSYAHTDRYAEAVKAYERATTLDPANEELKSALAEARARVSSPAAEPPAAASK